MISVDFVRIISTLAEKLASSDLLHHCFSFLSLVNQTVRKSYVCKLLFLHAQSKLMNRLADQKLSSFRSIFPEILDDPHIREQNLMRDAFNLPSSSRYFEISWRNVCSIVSKYFREVEVSYLVFVDFPTAKEMLEEMNTDKAQQLLRELSSFAKEESKQSRKISFSCSGLSNQEEVILDLHSS